MTGQTIFVFPDFREYKRVVVFNSLMERLLLAGFFFYCLSDHVLKGFQDFFAMFFFCLNNGRNIHFHTLNIMFDGWMLRFPLQFRPGLV